jgi:hypothetical protein
MKIEDDKKKTTVFVKQDGKTLKHYWNKDNPRDLPQLAKIKVKGKITYDDSDLMEYLEKYVNEQIIPKLRKPVAKANVDTFVEQQYDDEVPF